VAGSLSPDVFFQDVGEHVAVRDPVRGAWRVKVRYSDGALSFRSSAKAEQQLLTVLGLLKFHWRQGLPLLLDEPDTHLNPAWTVKYLGFCAISSRPRPRATSYGTHDPLALAGLQKGQVQIMWRDSDGIVRADVPESDLLAAWATPGSSQATCLAGIDPG